MTICVIFGVLCPRRESVSIRLRHWTCRECRESVPSRLSPAKKNAMEPVECEHQGGGQTDAETGTHGGDGFRLGQSGDGGIGCRLLGRGSSRCGCWELLRRLFLRAAGAVWNCCVGWFCGATGAADAAGASGMAQDAAGAVGVVGAVGVAGVLAVTGAEAMASVGASCAVSAGAASGDNRFGSSRRPRWCAGAGAAETTENDSLSVGLPQFGHDIGQIPLFLRKNGASPHVSIYFKGYYADTSFCLRERPVV